jgi:L-lactate dehydrogenase (cytochrome)
MKVVTMDEVARHDKPDDCWLVFNGKVYDLTKFHRAHPGGAALILNNAGKDATAIFNSFHPSDMAERLLGPSVVVAHVDPATIRPEHVAAAPEEPAKAPEADPASRAASEPWEKPPLGAMMNAFDFEAVAARTMDKAGWAYYSSGADDELSLRENHSAFHRVWLKPRVLVNVKKVDTSARMLGNPIALPMYFTATAMGKLAHPDGEVNIVRAAARCGVPYMLPTLSSCTLDEMLAARSPGQVLFSQLYVNKSRERNLEYIRKLEAAGVRALFITVDAPQLGRREKDLRLKFVGRTSNVQEESDEERAKTDQSQGVARMISSYIDPSLSWSDLEWFQKNTKMAIILKGVQCAEDALRAVRAGCQGIVLSNHGGRQLDTARSGIEILAEVAPALRAAGVRVGGPRADGLTAPGTGYDAKKAPFEVFVDGGVRRASDVFKAVAMGATAVGIGRPVLYSLAAYGQPGIERMMRMFRDELVMVMRLMGTPTIADVGPDHVVCRNLGDHISTVPRDFLKQDTYRRLRTPAARL